MTDTAPLRAIVQPDDIAKMVECLMRDGGNFITEQTLVIGCLSI